VRDTGRWREVVEGMKIDSNRRGIVMRVVMMMMMKVRMCRGVGVVWFSTVVSGSW
jgi:hypothetical protein